MTAADPARAAAAIARLQEWNRRLQARDPGTFTDDEIRHLRQALAKLERALDAAESGR